jgi:hypothetical protein
MRGGGVRGTAQTTTVRTSGTTTGTSVPASGTTRVVPTITNISLNPNNPTVEKGGTLQLEATITGLNDPDLGVTWTISGNTSRETTISEDGILTVAEDENITPLIVTVTSTFDRNRSANATVTVPGGISAINVTNTATWNAAINQIRNGGNNQTYIINVTGNISVPIPQGNENLFGNVTGITVSMQGNGTISPSSNGPLFRIGSRQMVIVMGNLTLRGRTDNNSSLIVITSGSEFRLEGRASVTSNTVSRFTDGGGVYVNGGTFIMKDSASVVGNGNARYGGGVYVANNGIFTMYDGVISNNISVVGGGVHINSGIFTMRGGIISNNTTNQSGDGGGSGVDIAWGGTFIMENGTISGNIDNGNVGGGGVRNYGTFTKIGGIIYGSDAGFTNRNTTTDGNGHAVLSQGNSWRNATAGPNDTTSGFGFFLND